MKLIALTAALAFSSAAIAQTTPPAPPAGGEMPMQDGMAPAAPEAPMQDGMAPATPEAPMQDGTTPPPPAPMAGDTTGSMAQPDPAMQPNGAMQPNTAMQPGAAGGTMTQGGYMPAQPPMTGMAQPGQTVRFQPSVPVAQAFPAPAPKAEYPVCTRGQTDGCRNRGE